MNKTKQIIQAYFNQKSLVVSVNHAWLGFYLCQSVINKYYGINNANLNQIYFLNISLWK